MSALLLPMPFLTALDNQGRPIANARLYLYETGGTNNATAYTTKALTTPHDQPIVADAAGRFPAIYLQQGEDVPAYRAMLRDANGAALADVDPINREGGAIQTIDLADGAVTAEKLAGTAISTKLGFTPIGPAGGALTGELRLGTAPGTLHDDTAGYIGAPTVTKTDDYPLVLSDAGKMIRLDAGAAKDITVPPNSTVPFPIGTMIGLRNVGAGPLRIASAAPVTVKALGSGTPDTQWEVAQFGEAWLRKDDTDTWFISGIGVS